MSDRKSYADELLSKGVTVVPVLRPDQVSALRRDISKAVWTSPELKRESYFVGKGLKRKSKCRVSKPVVGSSTAHGTIYGGVLGGFSALGNCSSFHYPVIRSLREHVMGILVPRLFSPYVRKHMPAGTNLEQIIDRLMFRPVFRTATAETWHRDEHKNGTPGDIIFGGWLNLDCYPQTFRCCPETHLESSAGLGRGFYAIPVAEHPTYESSAEDFSIPPGHAIIFNENIVHDIVPETKGRTWTMMRLFLGFRLTRSELPLIPDIDELLTKQAVIPLKSGQIPPMYSANHLSFHPKMIKTFSESWDDRVVDPETGLIPRHMTSLEEYNMTKFPPYTSHERAMHRPGRQWKVWRFDGIWPETVEL